MGAALEGGYDLGALALLLVAFGLLLATKQLVHAVAGIFDFSVLGYRPLKGIANALENGVVGALDDAIKGVERLMARFLSGLIDSWGMLIAIPALLVLGVKAALEYLWNVALRPLIHSIADPIGVAARAALGKVEALANTVAANVGRAEEYARARAAAALAAASSYVDRRIEGAIAALRLDISAGVAGAESYADEAVSRLRAAEDGAIATAIGIAHAAEQAGIAAAAQAEALAEAHAGGLVSAAEQAAAQALAASDAAGKAALGVVSSIAITAEHDLSGLLGDLSPTEAAALLASIPAIATLVHAIATEAGLSSAECRGKVGNICATDPLRWANLLAGLAAIGIGFNLRELAELAGELVQAASPLVREMVSTA